MEKNHHLLQPLLLPSTSSSVTATPPLDHHELNNLKLVSSNSSIIWRLSLVAFIGIVSIWATHEASKGFAVSIVNECRDTIPGKRFELLYVSNDEATRIIVKASKIIEDFLYPDSNYTKKLVSRVILRLSERTLTDSFIVNSIDDYDQYILDINPSIMQSTNFDHVMTLTMQQGVTRIWLWDGRGKAPKNLVSGIVEYITSNLGDRGAASISSTVQPPHPATLCWKLHDSRVVAEFLGYCERLHPGFIRRLNQAMKDEWHEGKLDAALGMPVQDLCTTYRSLKYNISSV